MIAIGSHMNDDGTTEATIALGNDKGTYIVLQVGAEYARFIAKQIIEWADFIENKQEEGK